MNSFQIQHPMVLEARQRNNLVQKRLDPSKNVAIIYFSSHSIYFPNDVVTFKREIIERDRYEWTNPLNTFQISGLNIYVRDLFKQWYIDGISTRVNSIERLSEQLQANVGSREVITVGSSAGGYAAVLFGALLGARIVYCFSGQFDLARAAIYEGGQAHNPLIWKYRGVTEKSRYYQLAPFITAASDVPILYFYGTESDQDCTQYETVRQCTNLFAFPIRSRSHGIPFYPFDLANIFARPLPEMLDLNKRLMARPPTKWQFSIQEFGLSHFVKNLQQKALQRLMRKIHLGSISN